jgi:hypothetical protein
MTLSPLSGTRYAGDVIQIGEWGLQVGRGRGEVFLFQFWGKFILDPSVGKLTGRVLDFRVISMILRSYKTHRRVVSHRIEVVLS